MRGLIKIIFIVLFFCSCEGEQTSSLAVTGTTNNSSSESGDSASNNSGGESSSTYDLSPSASSYDFGSQAANLGTSQTFTITNNGTGSVTSCSAASLSGTNASDFSISTDNCGTNDLAASGTCTIEVTTSSATSGSKAASLNWSCSQDSISISLSLVTSPCPDGYILVPANATVGVTNDFCVMQYEAKAWLDTNSNGTIDSGEIDADGCNEGACSTQNWGTATHTPVSSEDGHPWRRMANTGGAAACQTLGANYDLISNPEWMAIARNVEIVPGNWSGNNVGDGCLFRGNVGLADACGVNEGGVASGSGRDSKNSLTLTNGEVIWDFAGNVTEAVDWELSRASVEDMPNTCGTSSSELTSMACAGGDVVDAEYNSTNGSYTTAQGIGAYVNEIAFFQSLNPRRGGHYAHGTNGGAFTISTGYFTGVGIDHAGFRCVYRP